MFHLYVEVHVLSHTNVSLETISFVTGTVTKYIFCSSKSQGTIKKLR